MTLQTTTPMQNPLPFYSRRPACPRCGEALFAPEIAEFAGNGRIRHTWFCDDCDHAFRTCVEIAIQ